MAAGTLPLPAYQVPQILDHVSRHTASATSGVTDLFFLDHRRSALKSLDGRARASDAVSITGWSLMAQYFHRFSQAAADGEEQSLQLGSCSLHILLFVCP
jgi:hypothetical protein